MVEDDQRFADDVSLLLESRFDLTPSREAREALNHLRQGQFDAFLVDLDLPPALAGGGPDEGLAIVRHIRKLLGRSVRIVILSREVPDHLLPSLQILADAILLKPTPIEELERCLLHNGPPNAGGCLREPPLDPEGGTSSTGG
jgi:CheY-like chemotaxis protein